MCQRFLFASNDKTKQFSNSKIKWMRPSSVINNSHYLIGLKQNGFQRLIEV